MGQHEMWFSYSVWLPHIMTLTLVQTFQYLFRALTVLSFQATSCSETLNAGADVVFTSSSYPE